MDFVLAKYAGKIFEMGEHEKPAAQPKSYTYTTGCSNMICQTSNQLLGITNTLLSHKNGICTFMRCGNLTYDIWIWLKITSLSSTALVLNDGRNFT